MKADVFIACFPYGASEHPDIRNWMVPTVIKMKTDPRIGAVHHKDYNDTPITMTRNRALEDAKKAGADFILMIDSDMSPDLKIPYAKPFWDTTFEFMMHHAGPCCVAAPYCGPPPVENCYQFQWVRSQNDNPNSDPTALRLEQYSREQAFHMAGIQEAAALPTGLILIDMRALAFIKPPYFEYEWDDPPFNTRKSTTEDVYFTRNLGLAGVPQYVNWDAWAGHYKTKCVSRPQPLCCDAVRDQFREAIARGMRSDERIIDMRERREHSADPTPIVNAPLREHSPAFDPEIHTRAAWNATR